jgi:hypothetical protein
VAALFNPEQDRDNVRYSAAILHAMALVIAQLVERWTVEGFFQLSIGPEFDSLSRDVFFDYIKRQAGRFYRLAR